MILHIAENDKFIDLAINMFEVIYPNENDLAIISSDKNINFIKTKNVIIKDRDEIVADDFITSLTNYNFIVLHSLNKTKLKIVEKASSKVKFIWLGWGFDYYTSLIYPNFISLLLPKTKKFARLKFFLNLHKHLLNKILNRNNNVTIKDYQTIQKISFFSPVIKDDYDLIIEKNPTFKPKYISWNYGTLEDNLTLKDSELTVLGDNILLGNSATYENNHLDAFDIIAKIIKPNQKVIAPLSYGNVDYRNYIIKKGIELFGENFVPLTDFMPYDEYIKTISSCSTVIMNHLRQQAVGNIVIMMNLGAKIYLNENNPVYRFFRNKGAHIYSTDELLNGNISSNSLSQEEIAQNVTILQKQWSREVMKVKTKQLVETINLYRKALDE